MIFGTHNRTPKTKTNKTVKFMLILGWSLLGTLFLFVAIIASITIQSIKPALIILVSVAVLAIFFVITLSDMNRAYIKINEDTVTVIDYYFFLKKERVFSVNEIKKAEIHFGYSMKVRGYRHSSMGCTYIVFKNENNKYLFKIINCPETHEYFGKCFEISYT